MIELLFLLLPLAFYSGWRASGKSLRRQIPEKRQLSDNFVKGVNYLLDEEPDKALDVFLNRPEIDEYTAETYLLLGNLFRNRGEIDRALSVHQNLIGRASLNRDQKAVTMLALGKDFLAAGMIDRAESVFTELLQDDPNNSEARQSLRNIYEQTQEWRKAIAITDAAKNDNTNHVIAHYYCELAESALETGHIKQANDLLRNALIIHSESKRIKVLQADIFLFQQNYSEARKNYLEISQAAPQLLAIIFDSMMLAYTESHNIKYLQEDLFEIYEGSSDIKALEFVLSLSSKHGLSDTMFESLSNTLNTKQLNIRVISKAVSLYKQKNDIEMISLIDTALSNYLSNQPAFQCCHCGYKMHDFLWRCPACNQWDDIIHI